MENIVHVKGVDRNKKVFQGIYDKMNVKAHMKDYFVHIEAENLLFEKGSR